MIFQINFVRNIDIDFFASMHNFFLNPKAANVFCFHLDILNSNNVANLLVTLY